MRIVLHSLLGLVAIAVLAVLAAYLAVRGSLPELDGREVVTGPSAAVTIERDAQGAVTINGRTRNDVAYATGYVHAQDRYFQMDLARRMSAGRLSELVGDAALDFDLRHRRHRFHVVAAAVFAALSPAERAMLESYARGVNAGLDSLRARPFEYLLLRQKPEPWRAQDSLMVLFTMYLQLNDSDGSSDRQRGVLAATLPPAVLHYVYSVAPVWEAPIDGNVAPSAPMPTAAEFDLRRYGGTQAKRAALAHTRTLFENSAIGSNNWAVAGRQTRSGVALLANDMHLGLGVPNTWYRVHLKVQDGATGRDLMGITLPGAPILVVGSNGHIAWGFTNSYGDWTDVVRVERSQDGARYRSASGWKPVERTSETVKSSSGATRTATLERTEWGPLLPADPVPNGSAPPPANVTVPPPANVAASPAAYALAWTAQEPAATNLHWIQLETVATCEAALPVANTIGGPAQNFVCADSAGNIGWTLLGRMPLRGADYDAGVPADWTSPGAGWQGWRDPQDYPRILNPASGRIWTANNRVVGGAMLATLGDGSPDRGARAQQIRDDLFALAPGSATEADMLSIQLDERALFLARWRDVLLATLDVAAIKDHPARGKLRQVVARWTPQASIGAVGYLQVRAFHEVLERRVFDALTLPVHQAYPDVSLSVPRQFEQAVWELVATRPAHLLDPRFQDWRAFLLDVVDESIAASQQACANASSSVCHWGDVNVALIQHPLGRAVPLLSRWLDMPREPLGGDNDMPHVQTPGFGASERFAVSPGLEGQAYFHMPGGQSGHPLSPFYRAGHEAWAHGKALPFLPGPATHTLILEPRPTG